MSPSVIVEPDTVGPVSSLQSSSNTYPADEGVVVCGVLHPAGTVIDNEPFVIVLAAVNVNVSSTPVELVITYPGETLIEPVPSLAIAGAAPNTSSAITAAATTNTRRIARPPTCPDPPPILECIEFFPLGPLMGIATTPRGTTEPGLYALPMTAATSRSYG
jgi:hypothetical protein